MHRSKALAIAVTVAALSIPQLANAGNNKKMTPADQLKWQAAEMLYGFGLKLEGSKSKTTIAPGALTQAKWDRFVKEVYLPALQRISVSRTGTHFRWAPGYKHARWDLRGATKRAHIILEPFFKNALCQQIASEIGFKPNMEAYEKRKAWCAYKALFEGLRPLYEFRGKKVTWPAKRDRGDLRVDEEIFKADASGHYPIVITVAGERTVVSRPGIKIANVMTGKIDADIVPKTHARARAYWKKMVKTWHKMEAKLAAKQKRLARGKVAFSSEPFYDWVVRKPAKGTISCSSVYTLAYAPGKARGHGYAVAFFVDGKQCKSLPMAAGERDASDFHYTNSCAGMFQSGKVHSLRVSVHKDIITGEHKRVEWNKYDRRYEKRTYATTKLGKKLYEASVKCRAQ